MSKPRRKVRQYIRFGHIESLVINGILSVYSIHSQQTTSFDKSLLNTCRHSRRDAMATSVDKQNLSGDERRLLRCQERHSLCYIHRKSYSTNRMLGFLYLQKLKRTEVNNDEHLKKMLTLICYATCWYLSSSWYAECSRLAILLTIVPGLWKK